MSLEDEINSDWAPVEIFDLLACDEFIKLENRESHWAIAHCTHDGESIAEICDKDFNRLMTTWRSVLQSIRDYQCTKED